VEACVIPHLWNMIPGGYYQRQAGSDFNPYIYDPIPTIADHLHYTGNIADHAHWNGREGGAEPESVSEAGGGHAHSGFAICLSDAFPKDFRNDAFFFNIHGHRMNHDLLVRNGSGWTGKHGKDLVMSYDQWFLGVSIHPGPDGAFYFNDWYDATSCHRPDPERWDRSNGRVYRLRHGDVKPWHGDLGKWTDLQLAQSQEGHDEWQLRMARKVLEERAASGKAIAPEAVAFLKNTLANHSDDTRKLRALWTLRATKTLDDETVLKLAAEAPPAIQSWAIRIATEEKVARAPGIISTMFGCIADPTVQLAICSALQRMDDAEALKVASAPAILDPKDPNLYRMFWFGIERLVPNHPDEVIRIALHFQDERILQWTARRLESAGALDHLLTALKGSKEHKDWLLRAIATRLEFNPGEKLTPEFAELLGSLDISGDTTARDLAARAGNATAVDHLWVSAMDSKEKTAERIKSLKVLSALPSANQERWKQMLADPAMQVEAMELRPALLDLDESETAISGLDLKQKARIARLAVRENKIDRLLHWLETGRLRKPEVPADVVARLREAKKPQQQELVTSIFGVVRAGAAERQALIAEWHKKITPEVLAKADPKVGRGVFERTCAACHRLFGEGGQVGPELTGGDRQNISHWLDNVLDPNALIGPGYELHEFTKKDGSTITGMFAGENDHEYILKTVGVETRIPKSDVSNDKPLGISMMPEGLLTGMSDEEVANLIKYLSSPAQVEKP
jgi:putative heme-binding domain-containing protein